MSIDFIRPEVDELRQMFIQAGVVLAPTGPGDAAKAAAAARAR